MSAEMVTATASIWSMGKTWCVHAKHPDTGAWIRVHGIDTATEATWTANNLIDKLNTEATA